MAELVKAGLAAREPRGGNIPGTVILVSRRRRLVFCDPLEVVSARQVEEVLPCLKRVEEAVARGLYGAGLLAYEAAPAFDPALTAHPPGDFPLAWFGLYREVHESPPSLTEGGGFEVGPWSPLVSEEVYREAIRRIRAYIGAGDVYQVNYTFPLEASFRGDTPGWFGELCRAQAGDCCAFVNTGRFHILSASPELFFRLEGDRIVTRPMKGTRPRGRWLAEDRHFAEALAASEKDRAENVMIVDLLRNDLGRIAQVGAVRVSELFAVERYPTVWQMTSTIEADTSASVPEVFSALFPSGSVTGAPKVRVMQVIRELEPFPRGVYCGSVGWWFPYRQAEFNVAIRTVTVDTQEGVARYGVGGGITWESSAEGEYEECRVKTRVLVRNEPEFELLESLLFDGEYFLFEEHLARLEASAEYFDIPLDRCEVESALRAAQESFDPRGPARKVRLLVARNGSARVESEPIKPAQPVRVGLAASPVDPDDVFLFNKTTFRRVYEAALATRPDCADVLLWNPNEEITESTVANVVLEMDGELLTPPVECGLLPGTFRRHLLDRGVVRERVLKKSDLARAQSIRLINSVRKWIDVLLIP